MHEDGDEEAPPVAEGDYVVSVSGHFGFRRLHRIGACWRVPGKDYACYTVYGATIPIEFDFDACCKQCWPANAHAMDKDGHVDEQKVAELSRKRVVPPKSARTSMQRLADSDDSVSAAFTDGDINFGDDGYGNMD